MNDPLNKSLLLAIEMKKLGSWAQTQLIGAESGVSTYRADSFEVLKTLVEELGQNKTIIIDTPGVNIEEHLKEIKNLDREHYFT